MDQKIAKSTRSKWLLYSLLALYIGVSLGYQVVSSASFLSAYFGRKQEVQAPFRFGADAGGIAGTTAAGERAGLRPGDDIESINGVPYRGRAQWQRTQWQAHPGEALRLGVQHAAGKHAVVSVALEAYSRHFQVLEAIFLVFMQVAIPMFCLGLGYWVALARPLDANAWFVLVLLSYPEVFISVSTAQWPPGIWLPLRLYWHLFVEIAAPFALLWLGLLFPERSRIDVRMPWLKWCILALGACGLAAEFAFEYGEWYDKGLLARRVEMIAIASTALKWITADCVLLYWIAIFWKLRIALSADARRRLRVLCAGSVVGLGSMLVIFGGLPWVGIHDPGGIRWLDFTATLLMLAFPLSLAYVVIVQRALDVRILLRMGTKYALARTSLVAIELCFTVAVLVYFVSPAIGPRTHGAVDYTISALAVAAFIWMFVLRHSVSARLKEWLDRKFFREAYNAELILSDLAARVRTISDRSVLIETVSRSISEVLHVPQLAALLRTGEAFRMEYAVGVPVDHLVSVSARSPRMSSLAASSAPVVVYGRREHELLAEANKRALAAVRAEVILPLPGRSKLMGLLMLGPKLSEEPYSTSDLRLLESVGVQTGLGLEVGDLARSLASEAAQRERIEREIEIAREVQERLFPQSIPAIPGIDLAGHCRPALGIGGDYYDMFELEDGRLALAVGDVSGKGISAALLMASLRASLRSIAEEGSDDLGRLVSKLNRQVYEASATNRYATFFFAVFAPDSSELRYVNAGHNSPFVLRPRGGTMHLETGGTVVGLVKEAPYTEGTVQLQPGDVFVAYTDGVSEAMTDAGEEWGEPEMIASAAAHQDRCAAEILRRMMDAADAFTRGAAQHDDMTLLVLKLASCGANGTGAP